MSELLDYVHVRRYNTDWIRSELLKRKFSERPDFSKLREIYGDKLKEAIWISVTALTSCPFYYTFLSEESGSRYYRRGKLFEDFLRDDVLKIVPRLRKASKVETQKLLHTLVELDKPYKSFRYALIMGFADALVSLEGDEEVVVEFKSSFAQKPPVLMWVAQLSTYLRLYERMYERAIEGALIAYVESRDPPIAIWRVKISEEFSGFVKSRINAFLKHSKSPVDKTLCEICPIKQHCEYRTGSPYRAS